MLALLSFYYIYEALQSYVQKLLMKNIQRYMQELLVALRHVHAHNIIHRYPIFKFYSVDHLF
jgi:serine/threonine protein kinase